VVAALDVDGRPNDRQPDRLNQRVLGIPLGQFIDKNLCLIDFAFRIRLI